MADGSFYFHLHPLKEKLTKKYPRRDNEINTLLGLFAVPEEQMLPSLIVYGLSSTGKTSILLELLTLVKVKHCVVNCIEAYTNRLLLKPIIETFLGQERCETENIRCDSIMQFVHLLKAESKSNKTFRESPHIIVLKNCNKLSEIQLQAFARISELTEKDNLCCIMITQIVPSQFNFNYPIQTIVFPQYSKDDLLCILWSQRPPEYPEEFYRDYLNLFLGYFLHVCRDLKELKNWVKIVFNKYVEPIEKKELKLSDSNLRSLLFRAIKPYLQKITNCVYLGTDFSIKGAVEPESKLGNSAIDLPMYTKYLLIAAYLASFNSPKYDKRLYLKGSDKAKKRAAIKHTAEKSVKQCLGPKAFSLNRLLAIFYAICDEPVNLTVNIYSQIASLIELRLMMHINSDNLDEPKFKTTAPFSCVEDVGKNIKFDLKNYLLGV